jgi:hypothetical protein
MWTALMPGKTGTALFLDFDVKTGGIQCLD